MPRGKAHLAKSKSGGWRCVATDTAIIGYGATARAAYAYYLGRCRKYDNLVKAAAKARKVKERMRKHQVRGRGDKELSGTYM